MWGDSLKKHSFVIAVYGPEEITAAEIADHLADASRRLRDTYDRGDPMARLGDLRVYGMVRAADLPTSQNVHDLPSASDRIRTRIG
jgi:hypothetical protein